MKTWKLVSGILCMIIFIIVIFQSCTVGFVNSVEENGQSSGSAGIIVAVALLAGGIVSVATRNGGKGSNIALIIIFGLGALIGITMAQNYGDLVIWGVWCLICAIMAIIALIRGGKAKSARMDSNTTKPTNSDHQ